MKRTLVLVLVAVAGLVVALLLPRQAPAPAPAAPAPALLPAPAVQAGGSLSLNVRPARGALLTGGDDLDVLCELRATPIPGGRRAPVDLALVLDRSGSMSGEPLRKALEAARALVSRLEATDRLSIVHFGSEARLALALTAMTAEGRRAAEGALAAIGADGGTNMSDALDAAERTLGTPRESAIRRIVLLSDGQANEGLVGPGLVGVADRLAGRGLRLSALGIGIDFDEQTMLALADHGGGQYRYLRDADELSAALTRELEQAAATAASAVRLELTPAEGVEVLEAVSYQPSRDGRAVHVGLSDIAAGETRRVVVRVRVAAGAAGWRPLLTARVAYRDVPAGGREAGAQAVARAEATTDGGRVAQSWDREAARIGLRARFGGSLLGALRRYQDEDAQAGAQALDSVLDSVKRDAAAMGDLSFAAEAEQKAADVAARMRSAPAASAGGRGLAKEVHEFGTEAAR